MIHYDEWLPQAELLQPGMSVKVPHKGCSDSNALIISHGEEGYSCHCFKCHDGGFKSHKDTSWTEYQDRKKAIAGNAEARKLRGYQLPKNLTEDIPSVGVVWLLKGGLSVTLFQRFGIRWSETLQRVVIPCYNQKDEYIGFTARAVIKGHSPKYLSYMKEGEYGYVKFMARHGRDVSHTMCGDDSRCVPDEYSGAVNTLDNTVVIVEDFLSAARCSTVSDTIYLSGTTCSVSTLYSLIRGRRCILSLDPDRAGQHGITTLKQSLQDVADVQVIQSRRDPKYCSTEELTKLFKQIK